MAVRLPNSCAVQLGMHILRVDGRIGVVTGWKGVPGTKVMYNLEVAKDHTFTVGAGQWVVHNECSPQDRKDLRNSLREAGQLPENVDVQAHHLIPCQFQQDPLVALAIAGGFEFNSASNGIALPRRPGELDLPYHSGGHQAYNNDVGNQLRRTRTNLERQYGDFANVPDDVAAETVQGIANTARAAIEAAGGGVCINDVAPFGDIVP